MKKVYVFLVLIILAVFIYPIEFTKCNAVANIPISFEGTNEIIKEKTEKVELALSLGEFTDIPSNSIMGYEAVLEYDKNYFSSVNIEGVNGWRVQYSDSTNRIIGETSSTGEENKKITTFTFYINPNAQIGSTIVKLKNMTLTVNDDIDFSYEKEIEISVKEDKVEPAPSEKPTSDEDSIVNNAEAEQKNNEKEKNEQEQKYLIISADENNKSNAKIDADNTTANKEIPKTGIKTIVDILILTLITSIIFIIRYKSIKLK